MDNCLQDFLSDPDTHISALHDVTRIKAILETAACDRRSVSYSELLLMLGFRFTRPKMRAVCKTLEAVDRRSAAEGAPSLAVLVVREGDGLPGQGWWIGQIDYAGTWTGPDAQAYIAQLQNQVFDYWAAR